MTGPSELSSEASNEGPAASESHLVAGVRHHQAGDLDAAERMYRAVKRREGDDYAEAIRLRGLIAYQRGELNTAAGLLRKALKARPANPVYHHSLAEILRALDRVEEAITPYRRAYRLDPERADNGLDLAAALDVSGHSEEADSVYQSVLTRWPMLPDAYAGRAKLLFERGVPEAARDQLREWQASAPADTRHALARAWADIHEYDAAVALYRVLLEDDPADANAHARLGELRQRQGAFDDATAHLEWALDIDSSLGWAYAALLSNRDYAMSPDRERVARELAADDATESHSRVAASFALGQLYDQRGDPETAFGYFDRGNRLHAALQPFEPEPFEARTERIIQFFNSDWFVARSSTGHASEKPVFVVGMPRSGTSLVEQILASHPQAHGAGELEDMRRMVRELPVLAKGDKPFPQCLPGLTDEQCAALAQRYLATLDDRAPEAERVIDKMPFNMLWLGWIAMLFPNARVVYCRREPMDNCLSCYFQLFANGLRFTYDQTHLGHVYRQHERLMAHWAGHLPLSMLTVDYESLVRDPDAGTRRLIDFAGLEWDERCLAPHRTERIVQTASVWQARQPVYTASVARWRAYEPWLGELKKSLAGESP